MFPQKSVYRHKLFILLMSLCASLWISTGHTAPGEPTRAGDISVTEGMSHLQVQQADGNWIKANTENLELPVVVRTQNTGRSKISQGKTEITLNPNTELTLAASSSRAKKLISLIKQRVGSAIYKVEKHPGDFTVETPYLVSVVKGTRFSVVTDNRDSLVTVTEGLVEVRDLRSGENNMVRPGEIIRSAISKVGSRGTQDVSQTLSGSSNAANSNTVSSKKISSPIKISVDKVIDRSSLTETPNIGTDTMRSSVTETQEINTFETSRSDIDFETKTEVNETTYERSFVDETEQRFEAYEQKARDTDSFEGIKSYDDVIPTLDEFENTIPDKSLDGRDDGTFPNDGTDRIDTSVETFNPETFNPETSNPDIMNPGTSGRQDASTSPGGQT